MVVLDDEDFANLPLASSRDGRGAQLRARRAGRPVYFASPTICDRTGDGIKPYVLLRDALEKADRVAVVKVALRQRERLAMLRARDGVLVLQTLLWPDEVRDARVRLPRRGRRRSRPQELAMAESYISALSGDFDPSEYSDAVPRGARVGHRGQGGGPGGRRSRRASAPTAGSVVDLMDALRRSVEAAKKDRTATG